MTSMTQSQREEKSWKECAGRRRGPDTYQFGDFTRSLSGKITPRLRWKRQFSFRRSRQSETLDESAANSGRDDITTPVDPGRDGSTSLVDVRKDGSTNPLNHAQRGIETLRLGCSMFDDLDLPYGTPALQKIREGLAELECRIKDAAEWEQRCPNSAPLERIQVCFAAGDEDPPEWSMGQLYESSDALMFESLELPPWRIGPVRWDDIASLEKLCPSGSGPGTSSDIRLVVRSGVTAHLFFRAE
jgi:hypothetical protein